MVNHRYMEHVACVCRCSESNLGAPTAGAYTADLHEWDEETLAWRSDRRGSAAQDLGASTAPSARAHHGFVSGPAGLYAFGGVGFEGKLVTLL